MPSDMKPSETSPRQGTPRSVQRGIVIAAAALLAQLLIVAVVLMLVRTGSVKKDGSPSSDAGKSRGVKQAGRQASNQSASEEEARQEAAAEQARRAAAEKAKREAAKAKLRQAAEEKAKQEQQARESKKQIEDAYAKLKPTKQYVVRIGSGKKDLAYEILHAGDDNRYSLLLAGVTEKWRVVKLERLNAEAQSRGIAETRVGNGMELIAEGGDSGRRMPVVSIQPITGGLLFKKTPEVHYKQIEACLGDVAWIELYCKSQKKTVIVLTKMLRVRIPLERTGPNEASGKTCLPAQFVKVFEENRNGLKYPEFIADRKGYKARVSVRPADDAIVVRVKYPYEENPRHLRKVEEALAKATQEHAAAQGKYNQEVGPPEKALEQVRAPLMRAKGVVRQALKERAASKRSLEYALKYSDSSYKKRERRAAYEEAKRKVAQRRKALENTRRRDEFKIIAAEGALERARKKNKQQLEELKEAGRRVSKLTRTKASLDKREKMKQADAFGRFPEPLEFALGEEAFALFELKSPRTRRQKK